MRRCSLENSTHAAFFRLGDDNSSALDARFSLLDTGLNINTSVEVGSSHVDFSPFLFTLPSLILPLLPSPSPSPPSKPSQPLSFSSCPCSFLLLSPDTKIDATLSIQPIQIALYKDLSSNACSFTFSMGLTATFHSNFSSANFNCNLDSIRFVRGATIHEPSTGFNDLMIQSSLFFQCSLPNDLKEFSCSLNSSPLNFVFDTFSLLQLKDIIQSTIASVSPNPPSSNAITSSNKSDKPVSSPISSEVELVSHPPVVSVTLSFPLLRMILVSNTYSSILPVAFAELKDSFATLDLQEQFTSLSINTNLAAKYFKTEYGQWEACIEPWPLSFRYVVDYEELYCEPKTEFDLHADRFLNINVTSSLLRQTASYLKELDQLAILEPTSLAPLHASSPRQSETVRTQSGEQHGNDNFVCFVNHCGKTVHVSVSNATPNAMAIHEDNRTIEDGDAFYSNIPAFPAFQELLQEETVSNDSQEVTIRCDGYESVSMPLYSESCAVLPPRTVVLNTEDRQRVLVAHNHIQFGRKEIVLAGRVSVANHSGLPLFFEFSNSSTVDSVLLSLPNHCEVYAPAACCSSGELVLSTEAQCSMYEDYTRARIPLSGFDGDATAERCVQIGRKKRCIRLFATQRRVVLPTYDEVRIVTITLLPCLVIHNLLPVEVSFAISDDQNTRSGLLVVR